MRPRFADSGQRPLLQRKVHDALWRRQRQSYQARQRNEVNALSRKGATAGRTARLALPIAYRVANMLRYEPPAVCR